MYRQDTYKFYIVAYVRSCCRINTLFAEYRETSLVWCHIVTHAYGTRDNTGNRLVTFPCTQWIIYIYTTYLASSIPSGVLQVNTARTDLTHTTVQCYVQWKTRTQTQALTGTAHVRVCAVCPTIRVRGGTTSSVVHHGYERVCGRC